MSVLIQTYKLTHWLRSFRGTVGIVVNLEEKCITGKLSYIIGEGGSKNLVNLVIFALARKSSLKFCFLKIEVVCCNVVTGCVLFVRFLVPLVHASTFISFFLFFCHDV